jgi:endonuclease YncB( thermonuclease family)
MVTRLLLSVLCLGAAHGYASDKASKKRNFDKHDAVGTIVLNGEKTDIRWTDGDSFKINDGPYKGRGTRLKGYNTLEAYGPVHRWGTWSGAELFVIAKDASTLAAAHEWACTTDGKEDGYKRLLIDCPDLTIDLVTKGYALAYAVEGKSPAAVLTAQAEAQTAKRGMWQKGVVKGVITSLHSVGEAGDEAEAIAYNRVVDTRTGEAQKRKHTKTYASCEEVCEVTDGDVSCMVYVPFTHRYFHRPGCLFADHAPNAHLP